MVNPSLITTDINTKNRYSRSVDTESKIRSNWLHIKEIL